MSPEGVTGEVASAKAWPRSPTAASRNAFGSASAAGGSTSVFGDIGIPSAPTAVVSSNFPGMPSDENDVDVTVPVCWASRRGVAALPRCDEEDVVRRAELAVGPALGYGLDLGLWRRRRADDSHAEGIVAGVGHGVLARGQHDLGLDVADHQVRLPRCHVRDH